MNLSELQKKYPDLFAAVRQEGYDEGHAAGTGEGQAAGLEEGLEQGRTEGATAERNRIKAVKDQLLPGHGALIETLMFDGKTTGDQAAAAIVRAEKDKAAAQKRAVAEDAAELDEISASVETEGPKPASQDDGMTEAERIQAKWDGDASLRTEFDDDFDRFKAYAKNAGRTKVLGGEK